MDYIMILIAVFLLGINNILMRIFQSREGATVASVSKFNYLAGAFTLVVFLPFNGFRIEYSSFSMIMAVLNMVTSVLVGILGFKVMKYTSASLYTLFSMLGAMIVPYLFGIVFLDETVTVLRIIGLFVIIAALIIINCGHVEKNRLKILFFGLGCFIFNGINAMTTKIHSINAETISSMGFLIMINALKILPCLILYSIIKQRSNRNALKTSEIKIIDEKDRAKSMKFVLLISLFSTIMGGLSYFLQLIGAKTLPATVMFPMITGGGIVFTAAFEWIYFKEKLSKRLIFSILLCFAGTCMFL